MRFKLISLLLYIAFCSLFIFCSAVAAAERTGLIAPHGGKLVDLMLPEDKKAAAVSSATKTIELSDRNACDVELLTVG